MEESLHFQTQKPSRSMRYSVYSWQFDTSFNNLICVFFLLSYYYKHQQHVIFSYFLYQMKFHPILPSSDARETRQLIGQHPRRGSQWASAPEVPLPLPLLILQEMFLPHLRNPLPSRNDPLKTNCISALGSKLRKRTFLF